MECSSAPTCRSSSVFDIADKSDLIQCSSSHVVNSSTTRPTAVQNRALAHPQTYSVKDHSVIHDLLTSNSHSMYCQNRSRPALEVTAFSAGEVDEEEVVTSTVLRSLADHDSHISIPEMENDCDLSDDQHRCSESSTSKHISVDSIITFFEHLVMKLADSMTDNGKFHLPNFQSQEVCSMYRLDFSRLYPLETLGYPSYFLSVSNKQCSHIQCRRLLAFKTVQILSY